MFDHTFVLDQLLYPAKKILIKNRVRNHLTRFSLFFTIAFSLAL